MGARRNVLFLVVAECAFLKDRGWRTDDSFGRLGCSRAAAGVCCLFIRLSFLPFVLVFIVA